MKIRLVAAELFRAERRTNGLTDGQIDMTKSVFAIFRKRQKIKQNKGDHT